MILDILAESTIKRVEARKAITPLEELKRKASLLGMKSFEFENALNKNDMAFICEVKKASPSKGIIAERFPYLEIASEYYKAGADAISILTEPEYFKGRDEFLYEISKTVPTPLLRKDFTVDEYMIYEARIMGASAVLLICAILDTETLKRYIQICDSLGLSALVEAHTADEIESALIAGARVIGVNNRDLRTFEVDIENCMRLRTLVPSDIIFVAESGIKTAEDIRRLREAKVDAVLIGETLMRADDKKAALDELKN